MESNELQEHRVIKDSVISLLEEAKNTFKVHFGEDKEDNVKAFEELAEKTRDGRFSIIVVGEFSAGKSTFLNAIMGEKYLDSFSSETTANINNLKSVNDSPTKKPMLRVNYKDGKCETSDDVSFENIQKYVSTKGVDVAENIESVDIFLDSSFLNSGVDLIDSPGLNGVKALHADITKNQIKASHAAIFMFKATQPGSKSDFETLVELKKSCKSILVVLNRIDEAAKQGEETVEDIVDKLKSNFKEVFPNEKIPEIWPMSAYKALVARSKMQLEFHDKKSFTDDEKKRFLEESRIERFEERLMRYITKGEKAKHELLSPVEKVISVTEGSIKDLEMEKETLNGKFSTDDLNEQIDAVNKEIRIVKDTIAQKKDDVANAISDAVRDAKNSIKSDTKDLKELTLRNLNDETTLADLESNAKLYVSRLKSRYQSVYSDALDMLEVEFRNAVIRNIEGSVAIINKQLSSACSSDSTLPLAAIEIDSAHFNAEFDLSKYDTEIAEKQAARKTALENQYKAENCQLQVAQMKSQIQSIENSEQSIGQLHTEMGATMHDPGVIWRKEWRERECRGSERSIFNPRRWFGSKWKTNIQQYQEDVPDYTEHNLYLEQKKSLEEDFQRNVKELEDKKRHLEEQMAALVEGSRDVRKYEIDCKELEREISELRSERDEKLDNAIKKQLKTAKVYVESVFDSLENDSRKQMIQSFTEMEENLIQMAMSILEGEIKEELEVKAKKLEALKAKMTLAEKDKGERIQKIEDAHSALASLAEKAEAVRNTIESKETDVIKEQ